MPEKTVQKEPGKKPAPSKKPKPQQEVVVQIPLSELHPFPDHPFQVREDASIHPYLLLEKACRFCDRLFLGAPAEIRTPDTLLKRQVLCLLSYWGISV